MISDIRSEATVDANKLSTIPSPYFCYYYCYCYCSPEDEFSLRIEEKTWVMIGP
jgi:hypothetical protein